MLYSPAFYSAVIDPDQPIEDVVANWGAQYGETMIDASAGFGTTGVPAWAKEQPKGFEYRPFGPSGPDICAGFNDGYNQLTAEFLVGLQFPPWNWLSFINAMLKDSIGDLSTLRTTNAPTTGLAAALVVHAALGPDAYLTPPTSSANGAFRTYDYDGTAPPANLVIPVAHSVPAGGSGDWVVNSKVSQLNVVFAGFGVQPILTPNPTLLELLAGASAFLGNAGGGTWLQTTLDVTETLPFLDFPLEPGSDAAKAASVCKPFGLQVAASPLLKDGYTFPPDGPQTPAELAEVSEKARYRLADGGFIENTGAAPAIAAMQKDCAEGKLDCSGPLKIIVVDALDQSQGALRLFDFADGPPANGYYQYPYAFGATVASQQIFAEAPPEPGDFQQYAESEYPTIATQGPIGTNFDGNKQTAVSTYWHGRATTVDNDWYDVQAGSDVEILILNTALVTEGGVPTVVGGGFAEVAFAGQYGPLAKIQADGMKHIVTAFLAGTL